MSYEPRVTWANQTFSTLVANLVGAGLVWVSTGKGPKGLLKFWEALRLSKARSCTWAMDMRAAYGGQRPKSFRAGWSLIVV